MRKLQKFVVHLITYAACFLAGVIVAYLSLYFLVVALLTVVDSVGPGARGYTCGHGMFIGLTVLLAAVVGGTGLGAYLASKALHSAEEWAAAGTAWAYSFARRRRRATHLISAGAVVIAFSAFSSPQMFLLTASIGLAFALVGAVVFVWAHFARG